MAQNIKYPQGAADVLSMTATGAQAFEVTDNMTIIDGVSVVATGNRTINLTIGEGLKNGSLVIVESKTTATETTVFGTNITGATITGVAGKTINASFVYNGTSFVQMGAEIQID